MKTGEAISSFELLNKKKRLRNNDGNNHDKMIFCFNCLLLFANTNVY